MVLNDFLKTISPDDVVYLGCVTAAKRKTSKTNGSGFVYIGYAKNVPVQVYGEREVMETFPHESDHPGLTVLIGGMDHGNYWIWHECDPSVPITRIGLGASDICFENLLIGIAKQTIADYKASLYSKMREVRPTHIMEVDDIIKFCRQKEDLSFLLGSGMGEYLIQAVEDELRVNFMYPKAKKMEYEKRYQFMREKRHEVQRERLKKHEKALYASIKGRSVNHDVDG